MRESDMTLYEAQNEPVTVETEENDVYPEEWTEEAEKAFQDVIRRKELEQRQEELEAQIATLEAELTEVEKDLGVY